jgi:hypothetical protein
VWHLFLLFPFSKTNLKYVYHSGSSVSPLPYNVELELYVLFCLLYRTVWIFLIHALECTWLVISLLFLCMYYVGFHMVQSECFFKRGQTQCQRLPHEWGLGKGITEAKSYPRRNSAERRLRTQDLVTRRASTHQLHQACPSECFFTIYNLLVDILLFFAWGSVLSTLCSFLNQWYITACSCLSCRYT